MTFYCHFQSEDSLSKKPAEKTVIEKKDESEKPTEKPKSTGNFNDLLAKQKAASQGKWECDICMVKNESSAEKCISCESPNPSSKPKPPPSNPVSSVIFRELFSKYFDS